MKEARLSQPKQKPLDGISVVEYGIFHAGPGGTAILGDLGADVVKIETAMGDPLRYWTGVADLARRTVRSGTVRASDRRSARRRQGASSELDLKTESAYASGCHRSSGYGDVLHRVSNRLEKRDLLVGAAPGRSAAQRSAEFGPVFGARYSGT